MNLRSFLYIIIPGHYTLKTDAPSNSPVRIWLNLNRYSRKHSIKRLRSAIKQNPGEASSPLCVLFFAIFALNLPVSLSLPPAIKIISTSAFLRCLRIRVLFCAERATPLVRPCPSQTRRWRFVIVEQHTGALYCIESGRCVFVGSPEYIASFSAKTAYRVPHSTAMASEGVIR